MSTFLELLITVGRFLTGLWPLMFLAVLMGVFKRQKGFGSVLRSSIKALVVAWAFFALLHMTFFFLKMDTFHLIPEPDNSKYFLVAGLMLLPFVVGLVLEERRLKLNANSIADMQALSPAEFEALVAETYRAQGHQVDIVGSTGDHGIDLVVHTRRGETWLVQCKKYRGKVGEPVIRDFYGAFRASQADSGAVITTGLITDQARLWAEGKPLHLYDGNEFLKIVRSTRLHKSLPTSARKKTGHAFVPAPSIQPNPQPVMQPAFAAAMPVAIMNSAPVPEPDLFISAELPDKGPFMSMSNTPDCPICGIPMVLHTEKRLVFKPKLTYICANAPLCDETRPVD